MNEDNQTLTGKLSDIRGKYRKAVFECDTSKAQPTDWTAAIGKENTFVTSIFSLFTSALSEGASDMDQFYEAAAVSDSAGFPKTYQRTETVQTSQSLQHQQTPQRFGPFNSQPNAVSKDQDTYRQTKKGTQQNLQKIQQAILTGKVRVKPNGILLLQSKHCHQLTPAQIAHMECNRRIALALRESKKQQTCT